MRSLEWGRTIHLRDLGWAALVAVVAMGIALVYRSALVPTDPWHYVQGALAFPDGTWRPSGLSRWGFLLPIIPFARLWGDATATYYVVPVLSTGVLAAVLYLLGTRYVSRSTGALAAAFALGTPVGLRQPDPRVHRPHRHHPDRPGPAPGDPRRGRRRRGPGGRPELGVAGPRPARGLRVRDRVELRGPRDRDLRVAGDRLGAVAHRPAPDDPGVVRPTGPRVAGARCGALRRGVRRPVPQVPDHPGGRHLRVGGQLRRRIRRAVALVVHDRSCPARSWRSPAAPHSWPAWPWGRWAGWCSAPSWVGSGPGGC